MINAAIIGICGYGGTHFHDLKRELANGRVRPAAAVVQNLDEEPARVQWLREVGCEIFSSDTEMWEKFAGKIDLCCIPTGIYLHKPMTLAALAAGANVFVEKPVAATATDGMEMEAVAKSFGKFVAVGYQTMYQPETKRIKELILSGIIGCPKIFKCYALWPRANRYYQRNRWAGRLFTATGEVVLDSPFTNALAHDLNLLLFYAGTTFESSAVPVSVQGSLLRANPIESCDTASLKFQTSAGAEIFCHFTHSCNFNVNPVNVIRGDKGEIRFDKNSNLITAVDNNGEILEEFGYSDNEKIRVNVYDALVDKIQGRDSFICSAELASVHARATNGVFDSIPIVNVPDFAKCEVSYNSDDNDRRVVVPGIEKALADAWKEDRLLNNEELHFVQTSETFDMRGYNSFINRLNLGK